MKMNNFDLLDLAWWQYWCGNYDSMGHYFSKASVQSSRLSGQLIADWVARFKEISVQRKHAFDIENFTELGEWNALVSNVLGIEDCVVSSATSQQSSPSFILYRILGSDLPPRHYVGQTLANLEFILNHEPPLHRCQKTWIVNRIVDAEQEQKILKTLTTHHQTYRHIPFDKAAYARVDYDFESFLEPDFLRSPAFQKLDRNSQIWAGDRPYRPKNLAAINLNAVRNLALDEGQQKADWTLVLDGGCFMTLAAWRRVLKTVQIRPKRDNKPSIKHFILPMIRLTTNEQLFTPGEIPPPTEEPQIAIHQSSKERFDESLQYGRFTKVELFRRLKIPGIWDRWNYKPWERKQWTVSAEAGQWQSAGRVARLASGHALDHDQGRAGLSGRTVDRQAAVWQFIDAIDESIFRRCFKAHELLFFNQQTLDQFRDKCLYKCRCDRQPRAFDFFRQLKALANKALQHPAYSVMQKTAMPASGSPHDYFSLSAFSWPDPTKPDGLPYVFRDGQRMPATKLYSKESNQYDHARLQRTLNNTTTLAMAWYITGDRHYADHAANLVRTWFLDPATKMTPHLKYAQVEMGNNNNLGARWGIIDTKDFYYFLDAVKLLRYSDAWSQADYEGLQAWCQSLLNWLMTSAQGQAEGRAVNNHGTCYDLQVAALAGFCDDAIALFKTLEYSKLRLAKQFEPGGKQPQELKRSATLHYCTFNLQNWANLAKVAEHVGIDLWRYTTREGAGLEKGFEWLLPYFNRDWPYRQKQPFNRERFSALYRFACDAYPDIRKNAAFRAIAPANNIAPHEYSGIPLFWMLALKAKDSLRSHPVALSK